MWFVFNVVKSKDLHCNTADYQHGILKDFFLPTLKYGHPSNTHLMNQ